MDISVPVHDQPTDTLYLRQMIAEATDDDGSVVELSTTGRLILMDLTRPDGTRRRQTLEVKDLVASWMIAIDYEEGVTA